MRARGLSDACGGLAEDALPRVFDAGWRGTDARTPGQNGGAGLGLAIARGIVAARAGSSTSSTPTSVAASASACPAGADALTDPAN